MSLFEPAPARWTNRMLAVLRIVAGGVFITFGTMKAFGVPPLPAGAPPVIPFSQVWIGSWLEVLGGTLIVLGLFTRPTAFILSGFTAVAYWMVHAPQSPYPINNGGELAVLYCFVFFYLIFAGPGAWALDGAVGGRRRR